MEAHENALSHDNARLRAENEQLRRELATALHNATYMTAKVAEIDTERLALLDERDDLRNHFDAAVRRGDQFLAELDAARADTAVLQIVLQEQRIIFERHALSGERSHVDRVLDRYSSGAALLAELAALYKDFHTTLTTIGGALYTQGTGAKWQMDLLSFVRSERARLEREYDNAL